MPQWDFRQNSGGRWYWCRSDGEARTESAETFGTRISCIADAIRHGFLDSQRAPHAAHQYKDDRVDENAGGRHEQ